MNMKTCLNDGKLKILMSCQDRKMLRKDEKTCGWGWYYTDDYTSNFTRQNKISQIMKFLIRGRGGGGAIIPIAPIFNITMNISIFLR